LATFAYSGKETRKTTKLFKDTKIKIQTSKHNTKHSEIIPRNRQIQGKRLLPNEMLTLPAQISRKNRQSIPHHIQRAYTGSLITVTQDTQTTH
jgi:hypothetical protein